MTDTSTLSSVKRTEPGRSDATTQLQQLALTWMQRANTMNEPADRISRQHALQLIAIVGNPDYRCSKCGCSASQHTPGVGCSTCRNDRDDSWAHEVSSAPALLDSAPKIADGLAPQPTEQGGRFNR